MNHPAAPVNVAEECRRRDDCNCGLKGLRMRHLPTGREFVCRGSDWVGEEHLVLQTREARLKPGYGEPAGPFGLLSSKQLFEGLEPPAPGDLVRAEECVLLDPWPIVP